VGLLEVQHELYDVLLPLPDVHLWGRYELYDAVMEAPYPMILSWNIFLDIRALSVEVVMEFPSSGFEDAICSCV
jgi:hypothetical protein